MYALARAVNGMKALHYPDYDSLEIVTTAPPEPAEREVIVDVSACGICGSELETFLSRSPRRTPPLIMGHEFCGVVSAVGQACRAAAVGDRVVANAIVSCGACRQCARGDTHLCGRRQIFGMHRPGAFADRVAVPESALTVWPEGLDMLSAAMSEPLGNGVHVVNLTKDAPADLVVVIGAGSIGLCVAQAFKAIRRSTVVSTDLKQERLAVARRVGIEQVVSGRDGNLLEAIRALTDGEGADVVVDAVGTSATKRMSVECVRPGGAVVWIGLHENAVEIDSYAVTLPERSIRGTYGATMADIDEALRLSASGAVDVRSWITEVGLDDGVQGFREMLRPNTTTIKTVLVP